MRETAPLISVCIPAYQAESWIADTLASVDAQSFRDFEVVVVDDASSDMTVTVAQSCEVQGLRLYVNGQNLGHSRNWNRVMRLARGKYVKLLCCDDLLRPDCLAEMAAAMESTPSVSM